MTLEWKHMPWQRHAAGAWRLIADADTLARLGGAPCFSHALPGQVAYVLPNRGCWVGRAELTPYDPVGFAPRRDVERAKAETLAAVKAALPIDVNAWSSGGGLLCIQPKTDAGREWCADHINAEAHAGVYLAEHRYGPDILLAAHNAGLTVALDGQVADVPRECDP